MIEDDRDGATPTEPTHRLRPGGARRPEGPTAGAAQAPAHAATHEPGPRTEPGPSTQRLQRLSRHRGVGLAAGVLAGALIATGVVVIAPLASGPSCADVDRTPLRIVAAPEIAEVVSAAAAGLEDDACAIPVTVTAQDPAATAADLDAERGDRPDVWVPDSSVWAQRPGRPGRGVPADNPSLATSPVVLAMTAAVAGSHGGAQPTISALIPAADTAAATRWVLPEPENSAVTVAALIELQQALGGDADAAARYGAVVRTAVRQPVGLADLARSGDVAVPTTEQQLFAHDRARPDDQLVGAHTAAGFRFDYPYVVLAGERARRDRADTVLRALQAPGGQQRLGDAGFRTTTGVAGPALVAGLGPAVARTGVGPRSDADQVGSAIRGYTSILRPTRLLAVLDVSGSMANKVPGAPGTTRLDLAITASVTGLAVYPDDTVVGVWAFSTHLDGDKDFKEMAPLQELGRGPDGSTGRARVAAALARIRVTKGRTGLNDTVLAAVRNVRATWDPKRVNSVVVITDGGNSDTTGIDTPALLRTLRAEHDPEHPVAVFAIAYGPEGDVKSLQAIGAATGGRAYAAPDPRQIGAVLADAIGRRSCAPSC